MKNEKIYLVFQTGLDVLSAHNTEVEAIEAMNRIAPEYNTPLNIEEWCRKEAEEAYPELLKLTS